jgi:hypothetical protein
MGYAKVRASNLEIAVNGKPVHVLTGGSKGNFDFEINKSNVAQIMQSGEIGTPPATPRPAPVTPRPRPTNPAENPLTTPATPRSTPKPPVTAPTIISVPPKKTPNT